MAEEAPETAGGVCLCIVFNHPFTANIPALRAIYRGRFSTIRFLVPFERSTDPDVLTVYRGSFGHCAYAIEHLPALEALEVSYYVFIHDDVLLSPWMNEKNIVAHLGLVNSGDAYIGDIYPVEADVGQWGFQIGSLWRIAHPRNYLSGTGVESFATVLRYLPPVGEAAERARALGIPPTTRLDYRPDSFQAELPLAYRYFGAQNRSDPAFIRGLAERLFDSPAPASADIPYPLACSGPWTDFYVVPRERLARFAHIAAILATAGLFVEMAAPTALMLTCDVIRKATDRNLFAQWSLEAASPREALTTLLHEPRLISIHPVKLSLLVEVESFVAGFDVDGDAARAILERDYRWLVNSEFPGFDPDYYLSMYDDLRATNAPPYEHFYRFGHLEGRKWKPPAT